MFRINRDENHHIYKWFCRCHFIRRFIYRFICNRFICIHRRVRIRRRRRRIRHVRRRRRRICYVRRHRYFICYVRHRYHFIRHVRRHRCFIRHIRRYRRHRVHIVRHYRVWNFCEKIVNHFENWNFFQMKKKKFNCEKKNFQMKKNLKKSEFYKQRSMFE
jgi:hypothetical protein